MKIYLLREKFLYLLFTLVSCNFAIAQNIVNNPGFENHTAWPYETNQLNLCDGWSNCNGYYGGNVCSSPDYLSTQGTGYAQLPNWVLATVSPHSGDCIADFCTYDGGQTNYREYIRTYFTTPMIVGQTYTVSFYLTTGANQLSNYNTNNIGVLFSTDSVTNCTLLIPNVTPQINITSVIDTPDWVLYTFQYTADSAYNYITFGDFFTDANTTRIQTHNNSNDPYAQIFIDDISVSPSAPCDNPNLVNNPGFENHTAWPYETNQLNLCDGWSNCNGYYGGNVCSSPDYLSTQGTGYAQLPNWVLATVSPHSGDCIADFCTYDGGQTNYREYIRTYFTSPLSVGQTYTVSFYLTSGANQLSNYNTNNVGVLFTTDSVTNCTLLIPDVTPQINITSVIDTPDWVLYMFQYTADSAYNYITFGDFFTDANTTRIQTHNNSNDPYAQIFIDDISVSANCSAGIFTPNSNQISVSVYPNPGMDYTQFNLENLPADVNSISFSLYNCIGQEVRRTENITGSSFILNKNSLTAGIYFYKFFNNNGTLATGKVIFY